MPDAHANFAVSTVATAPSPATSGTSVTVATGHGSRFPAVPFNATIAPAGTLPDPTNSEIVRVTARSGDVLTITRAQESSIARSVTVGDVIAATITAKTLTDIETSYAQETLRASVKTTNYTAAPGELVPVDTTSGPVTVTLPAAPADRSRITVKHIIRGASNDVTVACSGSDVLNRTGGGTSMTLPTSSQGATYQYNAAAAIWTVVNSDFALSQIAPHPILTLLCR